MESSNPSSEAPTRFSAPADYVVDGIVDVLKKRRRWRYDGKSLRQLNKHWCLEINKQVKTMHPKKDQVITDEDVQSLLKFPMLTSLDVAPFCCTPQLKDIPNRCSSILRVLHQLPNLKELSLDTSALSGMQKSDIDGLTLKTVNLTGWDLVLADLSKLLSLPLENIGCKALYSGCLNQFPSLKRLSTSSKYLEANDIARLAGLEELEVHYWGPSETDIAALTSIVSLNIMHSPIHDFESISALPKLKKLEASILNSNIFDKEFWRVVQQLTSLSLESKNRYVPLPGKFWEMATGMEELCVKHLSIQSWHISNSHLYKLRDLKLWDCMVDSGCISFDGMTSLTALKVQCRREQRQELIREFMDPRPLRRLRELCIFFHAHSDMTEGLLCSISQLSNLESLELTMWKVGLSKRFPYSRFELLAALPNLSKLTIKGTASANAAQMLKDMKFLTGLDEVDIGITTVSFGDD